MWGVLRFYNLVRSGITWHGPEVSKYAHKANKLRRISKPEFLNPVYILKFLSFFKKISGKNHFDNVDKQFIGQILQ